MTLYYIFPAPQWLMLYTLCVVHYNSLLYIDGEYRAGAIFLFVAVKCSWQSGCCVFHRKFFYETSRLCSTHENTSVFVWLCQICRFLADCSESPGFAAHTGCGLRLCVTLVWPSYITSCEVVLHSDLVVCPAHPSVVLPSSSCVGIPLPSSPRLECLCEGICYFKPKMLCWVCKWWNVLKRKPYAVWDSFSVFYEHVDNWVLSKSWHILVVLDGRTLCESPEGLAW